MSNMISVIMSVYNEEKYIREAINSVLCQTYENFEFIIIDDCSTDNTLKILEEYSDKRIKLIKNTENKGLTKNLNSGLLIAKGKYIARMDGDDVCVQDRFEKQIKYMEENDNVYLISCRTKQIGDGDLVSGKTKSSQRLKVDLLLRPMLAHPGFFMRSSLLKEGYRYDEKFRTAQDFEFQVRVAKKYPIAILDEPLLLYRQHGGQVSVVKGNSQNMNADIVRVSQLADMGVELSEEETELWNSWGVERDIKDWQQIHIVEELIKRVCSRNKLISEYDDIILESELYMMLFQWCIRKKSVKYILKLVFSDKYYIKKLKYLFIHMANLLNRKCM